jgi:hypothetical protein
VSDHSESELLGKRSSSLRPNFVLENKKKRALEVLLNGHARLTNYRGAVTLVVIFLFIDHTGRHKVLRPRKFLLCQYTGTRWFAGFSFSIPQLTESASLQIVRSLCTSEYKEMNFSLDITLTALTCHLRMARDTYYLEKKIQENRDFALYRPGVVK